MRSRAGLSVLALSGVLACRAGSGGPTDTARSASPHTAASMTLGPASAAPDGGPPPSAASAVGAAPLAPVDFGPRGALVVEGYPATLGADTDVGTRHFGFADGAFVFCMENYGDERTGQVHASCTRVASSIEPSSGTTFLNGGPKEADAWAKEHALTRTGYPAHIPPGTRTPPVKGDWAFARDIRVKLQASSHEGCTESALFRVGGVVTGEAPVWIATVRPSPNPCNDRAWVDAVALTPDGASLGMVFRASGAHWDSEAYAGYAVATARLAAAIYNATAFTHHKAGRFARAAALFLSAAQADPTWELPAYNLACAYARAGDARAEDALREAVRRGGEPVKGRAAKDADFNAVRTSPWFENLTRP